MYKETVILSKPVRCISSNTGTENTVELELEDDMPPQKDEVFVPEPVTIDEPFDAQVMDPDRPNKFMEEQNELLAQIKNLLRGIEKSIAHHLAEEKNSLEQIFEKIPAIAFQIAEKVVHKKIEIDDSIILENLKKALASAGEAQKLKIIMNPNDIHIIKSSFADFGIDEVAFTNNWELEPNRDISPGGCLVKTAGEEIDARVESQLKALEESIIASVK